MPNSASRTSGRMNEVKEQAAAVGEDLRELTSAVGRVATRKLDPVVDYVDENPFKALLIAAGVGVLIGMMMKR